MERTKNRGQREDSFLPPAIESSVPVRQAAGEKSSAHRQRLKEKIQEQTEKEQRPQKEHPEGKPGDIALVPHQGMQPLLLVLRNQREKGVDLHRTAPGMVYPERDTPEKQDQQEIYGEQARVIHPGTPPARLSSKLRVPAPISNFSAIRRESPRKVPYRKEKAVNEGCAPET